MILKCPECGETSDIKKWRECEVYCEDCGSHQSHECPHCEERFDSVFKDIEEFKVESPTR